jgi:hypothetical protein
MFIDFTALRLLESENILNAPNSHIILSHNKAIFYDNYNIIFVYFLFYAKFLLLAFSVGNVCISFRCLLYITNASLCTYLLVKSSFLCWYIFLVLASTIKCWEFSTAQAGARGVRDVDLFFIPHVQTQSNRVCFFNVISLW